MWRDGAETSEGSPTGEAPIHTTLRLESETETDSKENGESKTPEVGSDENPDKEEISQSEVKASDDDSTENESNWEEDESAPSKEE